MLEMLKGIRSKNSGRAEDSTAAHCLVDDDPLNGQTGLTRISSMKNSVSVHENIASRTDTGDFSRLLTGNHDTHLNSRTMGGSNGYGGAGDDDEDDAESSISQALATIKSPAFAFSNSKKWFILCVMFWIQISLNFNASVYPNAVEGISRYFNVTTSRVLTGQIAFLVTYAFGCELWAPWSEELGRKYVLQSSLFLVNVWQILCALAPNFTSILIGRTLGGLSSAGGSVTLGVIADMYDVNNHQYAVNFIVLASVSGSVVGPIAGGFMEKYLFWRWNFWIQLMIGFSAQIIHMFVPETNKLVLVKRSNSSKYFGAFASQHRKIQSPPMTWKRIITTWARPFKMFILEPIVLLLSLLSGFSDALIYTFLESFRPVFSQWHFDSVGVGLAFISIAIGYFIAYLSFFYPIGRFRRLYRKGLRVSSPEDRLWWLLYLGPLLPIGLFGFAWSSGGPSQVHWIVPMIFATLVGIANFAIYMATIDYMVAAYGRYAASATGGNGFARDFLAGISATYANPLYSRVGRPDRHLQNASTILACIASVFILPIYAFYHWGREIRAHSAFAKKLQKDKDRYEDPAHEHSSTCLPSNHFDNPS